MDRFTYKAKPTNVFATHEGVACRKWLLCGPNQELVVLYVKAARVLEGPSMLGYFLETKQLPGDCNANMVDEPVPDTERSPRVCERPEENDDEPEQRRAVAN